MAFEARILGPVEASLDGQPVLLGSPKQRAIFALLVLNAGRVVPTERLVDELWGDDPPESPSSSVQVYMSRLRRSLEPRAAAERDPADEDTPTGVRLLRRGAGYQLDIPTESVDAHQFAGLVTSARAVLQHHPPDAQRILDQALALARGPALADVVGRLGPNGAAEAKRLDDLRLVAQETRLDTLLAQGDAATAAADAEALVREHPLREDLRAALMLSLYRAGRQGEALEAYDAVREELADELGIDPGAALRELHAQILRQDPALDHVPAAPTPAPVPVADPPTDRQVTVAARGPGVATGALPEPLTSLVGRDAEVDVLVDALGGPRLTALLGPGGAGKTRLAQAVAGRARTGFADRVWWVDVSVLDDPATLPRIVAAALGGHEDPDRAPLETAIDHLGAAAGLLVLDNCEHLVEACAEVVTRLLGGCPGLRVLVTTREPLGVPGELVWPVQPLGLPASDSPLTRAALGSSAAVRLWCERAGAALRGFELDDDNAATVARICRRLDGLPLAIELAAARLRVLSLEEIADALDLHLEVLVAGDRGVPARHRTLRATLDWSFQLLSPAEQLLLAQLSVFHGGFTLDAVTAIREQALQGPSSLAAVSGLIDRSLVSIADRGRPTRYRLLETVRLYAAEQLVSLGDSSRVSERHLTYYLDLAEVAEPGLVGPHQRAWLDLLDAEVANLIVALRWSVGAGTAPDEGLRLVSALWRFWYLRGHYAAGREWLDAALGAAAGASGTQRASALAAAGRFAYLQCDYDVAAGRLAAALEIYRSTDDALGTAMVLQLLGCVARERGEYAHSRDLHRDSLRRWQAEGRQDEVARSANYLGFIAWLEGDWDEALRQCGEALMHFRATGDGEGQAWSLIVQGAVACYAGDQGGAEALLEESRRLSAETRYPEGIAWSLNLLGVLATRTGDAPAARALLGSSLRAHWELGDRWRTASVLEALAVAEARTDDPAWAGQLLGAADEVRARLGVPTPPVERADLESLTTRLTSGQVEALEAARARGRRTPLESTVSSALARTKGA